MFTLCVSLQIVDINPLPNMSFNVFSHYTSVIIIFYESAHELKLTNAHMSH